MNPGLNANVSVQVLLAVQHAPREDHHVSPFSPKFLAPHVLQIGYWLGTPAEAGGKPNRSRFL